MADFLPPDVLAVIDSVDTYLRWHDVNQAPRGHQRIHPSAFGKCLRQMQYERYEELGLIQVPPEEKEPWLLRIFGNGHSMHDRWRQYFEDLGVLMGYWTCMNPFCAAWDDAGNAKDYSIADLMIDPDFFLKNRRTYGRDELQGCFKPEQCKCGWKKFHYDEIDVKNDELNIYGHADMILDFSRLDKSKLEGVKNSCRIDSLPTGRIVADMKSINHFGFTDVAKGNPHDYYLVQLKIYANILQCDYGILIYENKNNQKVCAFKVEKDVDTLWPQIQNQMLLMRDMAEVVDEYGSKLYLPPPRPVDQEDKDCGYCKYKSVCHSSGVWEDPDLDAKRRDFYGDLL
jgi:hypothetical protein